MANVREMTKPVLQSYKISYWNANLYKESDTLFKTVTTHFYGVFLVLLARTFPPSLKGSLKTVREKIK